MKYIAGLGATDVCVCVACAAAAYTGWFSPEQLDCGHAGVPLVEFVVIFNIHIVVDIVGGSWDEHSPLIISLIRGFKDTNLVSLNVVYVCYSSDDECIWHVDWKILQCCPGAEVAHRLH